MSPAPPADVIGPVCASGSSEFRALGTRLSALDWTGADGAVRLLVRVGDAGTVDAPVQETLLAVRGRVTPADAGGLHANTMLIAASSAGADDAATMLEQDSSAMG